MSRPTVADDVIMGFIYILWLQNDDATQQVGRVKQANQQRLSIPSCYRLGPADDS
jgi:hypothetical protein